MPFQTLWGDTGELPSELMGQRHDYPAGFHLHTASWFNLDSDLKGTDGLGLSNNHPKGEIGSVEPWIRL